MFYMSASDFQSSEQVGMYTKDAASENKTEHRKEMECILETQKLSLC